ncbi:MAG: hypothetical protein NTW19_00350 [Planctomycetota bacterium]|nr:hypothetical protein [Planctomycetota bacterium]
MSQFNAPAYDIERPTGQCAFTGAKLLPGQAYIATLVEVDLPPAGAGKPAPGTPGTSGAAPANDSGFKRLDVSLEAWQSGSRPERLFSFWRSIVPEANQKRKMFVDDDVLMGLFRRLADTDQPQRLAFRFVLSLILMRKRLLKYESSQRRPRAAGEGSPQEWWRVSAKAPGAEPEFFEVLNPEMDDTQTQQVTQQLGEILETEL